MCRSPGRIDISTLYKKYIYRKNETDTHAKTREKSSGFNKILIWSKIEDMCLLARKLRIPIRRGIRLIFYWLHYSALYVNKNRTKQITRRKILKSTWLLCKLLKLLIDKMRNTFYYNEHAIILGSKIFPRKNPYKCVLCVIMYFFIINYALTARMLPFLKFYLKCKKTLTYSNQNIALYCLIIYFYIIKNNKI